MEDEWYSFLDTLDSKKIPVYSIVDPIDKAVPSLAVFILLILTLASAAFLSFAPFSQPHLEGSLLVFVEDEHHNTLNGISVQLTYGNTTLVQTTNEKGIVRFNSLPIGTSGTLLVQEARYEEKSSEFILRADRQEYHLQLNTIPLTANPAYFQLTTNAHLLLEGQSFSVTWSCEGTNPVTKQQTITNAVLFIPDTTPCETLRASVSGSGYEPLEDVLLRPEDPFIVLQPLTYSTGVIRPIVSDAQTHVPISGVEAQLYTQEGILVASSFTGTDGVTFSGVGFGTYYLSFVDPASHYASTTGSPFVVADTSVHTNTYYLIPAQIGPLSITVMDAASGDPIPNATVNIQRVEDGLLVNTLTSAFNGKTTPYVPEQPGKYQLITLSNGYVSHTQTVDVQSIPLEETVLLSPSGTVQQATLHVKVNASIYGSASGVQLILYDASTQLPVLGIHPLLTNPAGEATFMDVGEGTYFVRANSYPYQPVESIPITLAAGQTKTITIDYSPSLIPGVFTIPNPSAEQAPSFAECETNCLPPLFMTLSQDALAPFESSALTLHVTALDESPVVGAKLYVTAIAPSGTTYLYSTYLVNGKGDAVVELPASDPGTHYLFTATHPGFEPVKQELFVENNPVVFAPPTIDFTLPAIPGTVSTRVVLATNKGSTSPVHLAKVQVSGAGKTFLDPFKMSQLIQSANPTPILVGEQQPLTLSAVTLPELVANPGDVAEGQLILTFESSTSGQKWVQSLPFTAMLENLGSCDSGVLSLSGVTNTNILELDPFEKIAESKGVLQNICTINGTPVPLQNLSAKVTWKGKALGKIQLLLTDPQTHQVMPITVSENGYTPLLSSFKPGVQYPLSLVFVPQGDYVGEKGTYELFFQTQSAQNNDVSTTEKGYLFTLLAAGLETCVKITPTPDAGVYIPTDEGSGTFIIDASACGKPVDFQLCGEPNNKGCSGGAPQGKLFISPATIHHLTQTQKVTVQRKDYTLPGTYDVTVRARTSGAYRPIARVNVKVDAPKTYALDMLKTNFSIIGKGATDSTIVTNRLLKETVGVTSGLCNWMQVSKHQDAPFAPVFIASTAANLLADALLPAAFDFSVVGALTPGATPVAIQAIEEVINQVVSLVVNSILGFGGGAAGNLAVAALNPCIPCTIIGIIVTLLLQSLLASDSQVDLCAILVTVSTMEDYVINLQGIQTDEITIPPDALDVQLYGPDAQHVSGEWSTKVDTDFLQSGDNGEEVVGVTFTNKNGYSNENPTFSVAQLRVTEHIHGDPNHKGKAEVECANGDFQSFLIGPDSDQGSCSGAEDTTRSEYFHVRFKTTEYKQILPTYLDDRKVCQSGFVNGFTGPGSLPRVAFNWKWNEANGIPLYACDASNPEGIYCDATQFNIDVMKRVHALEEFLAANNYQFACPQNPNQTPDNYRYVNSQPNEVQGTKIHDYGYDFQTPTSIQLSMKIENTLPQFKDINFTATMISTSNLDDYNQVISPPACQSIRSLVPTETFDVGCIISGLKPEYYLVNWQATDLNTGKNLGKFSFGLSVKNYAGENASCENVSKSTSIQDGEPILNQWVDAADEDFGQYVNEDNVIFTKTVPSISALNALLHYDAYLIQDGYSHDFENDFREYYVKNSFADAPVWYKGTPGQPGYQSFYGGDDIFQVRRKYDQGSVLTASGRYHVDIDVDIQGDDWKFFDEGGNPKLTIDVKLLHRADPAPNSPFYRLPFDGEIGLVKDKFDRKGYGLNFVNSDGFIYLNEQPVITYSNTQGNTYSQLHVEKTDAFATLNTNPQTRGQLLYVNAPNGSGENTLVFSPSLATPVVMKINASTTKPFTAFYQLGEGGNPVDSGQNLTFWSGVNTCSDFSGNESANVFNQTPDRRGVKEDKRTDWPLIYGIDWPLVNKTGDVHLRTIFYTPTTQTYTLLAATPNVSFLTSNYGSYSSVQILDGTQQLLYNNKSSEINSIQDIFDLVANESICIEDNGVDARFVWNTAQLYQEFGQTSINQALESLSPGQTCIAP